jgi:quercetin dioxygenase-like cupin family protein
MVRAIVIRPMLAWAALAAAIVTTPAVASPPPQGPDPGGTVTHFPPCDFGSAPQGPGLACLLAHQDLGALPAEPVYWHIDTFPDEASARGAKSASSSVVTDFGKVWMFTIAGKGWQAKTGTHVATIGPLPVTKAPAFSVEYLHSFFAPGQTAKVHKHSGPEAFYAIEGDTCLEMPGGVQTGIGPGNSVIMAGGPPMLLMALGKVPRRAFAMILHDSTLPDTTRITDWTPPGLCAAKMAGR